MRRIFRTEAHALGWIGAATLLSAVGCEGGHWPDPGGNHAGTGNHVGGTSQTGGGSQTGVAGCAVTTIGATVLDDFGKDTEQYALNDYVSGDAAYKNLASASTLSWDNSQGDPAAGALKVVAPFNGYKQFVDVQHALSTPVDLTNMLVFARIKVTPKFNPTSMSLPYVVFYIKTGSEWVFGSTYSIVTRTDEWFEITLDPATATTYGSTPLELTQTVAIGVQLYTSDGPDEGSTAMPTQATFWVDNVGYRPNTASGTTQICVPVDDGAENQVVVEPSPCARLVRGSRWRGFNLMGRYTLQWTETNQGFKEKEFAAIADLGFNYVRLPVDYRTYTKPDNWLSFDTNTIATLDDAITWGQKYGVHVDLNLHRAPGYCVHDWEGRIVDLPPSQDLDLWTDPVAQDAFVEHWSMLARRYQKIAPEYLSFNLVNEPTDVSEGNYVALMTRTIQAIHAISADRVIVVDGTNVANDPIFDPEFLRLDNVVQSKHCYDFPKIQFYDTSFNPGSENWPVPHWPPVLLEGWLWGPYQVDTVGSEEPLVIEGDFPAGTKVTMHINQVNFGARFVMQSDQEVLVDEQFFQTAEDPTWVIIDTWEGNPVYGKTYDTDFTGTLSTAASSISFDVTEQNMLDFTKITIDTGIQQFEFVPTLPWGVAQTRFSLTNGTLVPLAFPAGTEQYYDLGHYLDDWRELAQQGVPVMVGEFAQSNSVPYADAYRFYEFLLGNLKSSGFGWAHWSFESTNPNNGGAFINHDREGATYEDYDGYQLDRNMLKLFQAY